MSKLIIIVGKNGLYPSHLSGGKEVKSEKELEIGELIRMGRFFSRCGGYISTVKGVREALKHSGWVKFASSL